MPPEIRTEYARVAIAHRHPPPPADTWSGLAADSGGKNRGQGAREDCPAREMDSFSLMLQHPPVCECGMCGKPHRTVLAVYLRASTRLAKGTISGRVLESLVARPPNRNGIGPQNVARVQSPVAPLSALGGGRGRLEDVVSFEQGTRSMTYCIGVMLDQGMIFASDSRTNAGVDNLGKFCKMTVFENRGDRVIVLLSSGNLAGTQAVIGVLNQRCAAGDGTASLWNAQTMFDVAMLVSDAMRAIEKRDAEYLEENEIGFNASFIVGGQINGEPLRLFRIYSEGNFIEAGVDTPYFQTGETKYGKPIIERVITRVTPLPEAAKCVLVSFDSTMRSNLSVGMPIDLICYERDSLAVLMRRRFDDGDAYFTALSQEWREGSRQVFRQLPELEW
jgi:putative proteasome-type protease